MTQKDQNSVWADFAQTIEKVRYETPAEQERLSYEISQNNRYDRYIH